MHFHGTGEDQDLIDGPFGKTHNKLLEYAVDKLLEGGWRVSWSEVYLLPCIRNALGGN